MNSIESLLGRFTVEGPAFFTAEDLHGALREAILRWQSLGLVDSQPSFHPCPSCPHCCAGVPTQLEDRLLCDSCFSVIAESHQWAWPLQPIALCRLLADHLQVRTEIRCVERALWQLGFGMVEGRSIACFMCLGQDGVSEAEKRALATYRSVLVLHGQYKPEERQRHGHWIPLVELFAEDGSLLPKTFAALMQLRGDVRFDENDGSVRIGGIWAGELVADSKEFYLVATLAKYLNQYVPYTELKRIVLERTGSRDSTEAATFCQKLKNRIKRKWIPAIDRLIVTSNKGEGYRLRGYVEL